MQLPDSEACEIYALAIALRNCIPPIELASGCANLVADFHSGASFCTRHEHAYCHVWKTVWWHLDDLGAVVNGCVDPAMVNVVKTPAHITWSDAQDRGVPLWPWQLHRYADVGTKWAAQFPLPKQNEPLD